MGMVRMGVHRPLEDEADRIIRESLVGVTKHSDKADILTPWKEQSRYSREVYVASGVPDPSVRRGIFGRVANPARPELNSRDGVARQRPEGMSRTGFASGLADFVAGEHGSDE
jgi:hypothetical protein